MRRLHLFEFEDFDWFPDFIRNGITDYLRFLIDLWDVYKPAVPLIKKVIVEQKITEILDLCSGGGGYILRLNRYLNNLQSGKVKILLSDKNPNLHAFEFLKKKDVTLDFLSMSVDAGNVPQELKGMRTLFSAFHHFDERFAKSVLSDAVKNNVPIGIFEAGERRVFDLAAVVFATPILYVLATPFIRPYKFSRLLFTYIVPLIPLFALWDGIVSMLRMYSPGEMLEITKSFDNDYYWESGTLRNILGTKITYMIGYSKNKLTEFETRQS
jgi:hypothetical protein